MKKTTRSLVLAAFASLVGALLLIGGPGSLAYWQDTETSTHGIQSGALDLGPITASDVTWQLSQRIPGQPDSAKQPYNNTAIVPGDVLTTTVNVPVSLVGQTLSATIAVSPEVTAPATPTAADTALRSVLTVTTVAVNGTAGNSAVLTAASSGSIPVTVEVALPWGTAGQYSDVSGGTASVKIAYTLTQNPAV